MEHIALVDPKHFRDVLGSYPTGVCVVTSRGEEGQRWGLAVGSFTSISLDPPLVGFLPDKRSRSWAQIGETGQFCVNVLASEQLEACQRFASRHDDKFEGIAHGTSPAGLPLLDNVLAWIDCDIERVVEIGDGTKARRSSSIGVAITRWPGWRTLKTSQPEGAVSPPNRII